MVNSRSVLVFLLSFSLISTASALKLVDLEKARLDVEQKKAATDIQITQTTAKIVDTQERLKSRKKYLSRRLRALQYLQSFRWGSLLAIENAQQLEKNLKTLKFINQYDLAQLQEYKFAREELAQQQKLLVRQSLNLKKYSQQLIDQEQAIRKLELQISKDLVATKTKSLLLLKGQLQRPVDGQLVQNYGVHSDSDNQYSMTVKGQTYSVPANISIQAVGPGVVIFRDRVPYWGESVIVQHDGDYYSVYTQIKNCNVNIGDSVQTAEKLCETRGGNFYFELRHQAVAVNPKLWIKDSL